MKRHIIRLLTLRRYPRAIYAHGLVKSESRDEWYEARVLIDWSRIGEYKAIRITGYCTCPAFKYGKPCKHVIWLANKALARVRLMASAN